MATEKLITEARETSIAVSMGHPIGTLLHAGVAMHRVPMLHSENLEPIPHPDRAFKKRRPPCRPVPALHNDHVVHHVDASWNQAFTGTDMIRFNKLDGSMLEIWGAPAPDPYTGRTVVHRITFEKWASNG